jgi:hypothetical protein
MIAIGKLKAGMPEYEDLPNQVLRTFKQVLQLERERLVSILTTCMHTVVQWYLTYDCDVLLEQKDHSLVPLGRFFGDLFDKFSRDVNEPMELLYVVATSYPIAIIPFFYGMLCSDPDPYTMLPRVFDYCKSHLKLRSN